MKEDKYKTSKGYSLDRKIADYKQKLAQQKVIRALKLKPVKKPKLKDIHEDMFLIKRRNTYLGSLPTELNQKTLTGIEPRVKFRKGDQVASIHDRAVM